MAHIDTTLLSADRPSLGTRLASFFVNLVEARARALQIEARGNELRRLMALDDAELARMGLRRDRVPSHVFRDLLIL